MVFAKFISVWDPDCDVATIGYDNAKLAERAVRCLMSKGPRSIAVVHGPLSESDRTVACRSGAEAVGHSGAELEFLETELSVAGGKAAVPPLSTMDLPAADMGHGVAQDPVGSLETGSALKRQLLVAQLIEPALVRQLEVP